MFLMTYICYIIRLTNQPNNLLCASSSSLVCSELRPLKRYRKPVLKEFGICVGSEKIFKPNMAIPRGNRFEVLLCFLQRQVFFSGGNRWKKPPRESILLPPPPPPPPPFLSTSLAGYPWMLKRVAELSNDPKTPQRKNNTGQRYPVFFQVVCYVHVHVYSEPFRQDWPHILDKNPSE